MRQNDLKEAYSRETRKLLSLLGEVGPITPTDAVFKATFFDVRYNKNRNEPAKCLFLI